MTEKAEQGDVDNTVRNGGTTERPSLAARVVLTFTGGPQSPFLSHLLLGHETATVTQRTDGWTHLSAEMKGARSKQGTCC